VNWRRLLRPVCRLLGHRPQPYRAAMPAGDWVGWSCQRCDWCCVRMDHPEVDDSSLFRLYSALEQAEAKLLRGASLSWGLRDVDDDEGGPAA
jgi:hypothetical protein